MEEEKTKEKEVKGLSRREFLKDAGLVVGGTAVGSMAILSACKGETTTVTSTKTVTTTAAGGTTTVTSPGGTATVTSPPVTTTVTVNKFVDPYSGQTFNTSAELKAFLDTTRPMSAFEMTSFTVNDVKYNLADLDPGWSLMFVLREKLGLVGTKNGCNRGECGTCSVIMNGKAVYSCVVLACEAGGANIETIEHLSTGIAPFTGIIKAIYDTDALQCGYCAPGFIMASKALLDKKPKPTIDEVREALSGHVCTCGNIKLYVDAVLKV
jgi:carbon-monoxide dehydrogenase small subunit